MITLPSAFKSSSAIVSDQLLSSLNVTDLPVSSPLANNLTVNVVGR